MVKKLDTSLVGQDFRELSYQLLYKPNYLPDCLHDIKELTGSFSHMVNVGGQFFGVYHPSLVGFFFLADIIPSHEATFFSWFWGRFPHGTVRFIQDYISEYSKQFGLCRIVARTPDDKKHGRILEMCGFKLEGRFKSGYRAGHKTMTLFQYRILKPSA
jgi:hypothetical protein